MQITSQHSYIAADYNIDMNLTPIFAANLKALREARGWTYVDLEKRSGVSRPMITAIERGRTEVTIMRACMLAKALGRSLIEMLSEDLDVGEQATLDYLTSLYMRASQAERQALMSVAEQFAQHAQKDKHQ